MLRSGLEGLTGYVIVGSVLYWMTAARPLVAEPWQWADDGLFLLHGERIAQWICHPHGPWLGPYDPILLAKPPAFGLWLALVHLSGVPLRVAEFALLLLLPFLFRRAVRPLVELAGWRFLLVMVFLVGVPDLAGELRLLRTGLQAFAAAGVLIGVIGIVLRSPGSARTHVRWAALVGLFYGIAYLNREESPWLLPAIVAALVIRETASWRAGYRRGILVPTLTCAAAAGALLGAVSFMNWHHYGLFVTATRRAPNLVRLHDTLTRLQPRLHQRYVPIVTETRLRAYSLSPSFARLQAFLDGPPGDEIARNPAYNVVNGRPPDTREFYATFTWALLRAADHAGAHDAVAAERLFGSAADELETAIGAGRIRAGVGGFHSLVAPVSGDGRRVLGSMRRSAILLFSAAGMIPQPAPTSSGVPADVQRMADLTHSALAPLDTAAPRSPVEPFRRRALEIFMLALRFAYPAAFIALIVCIGWAIVPRRRSVGGMQMAAGAVLLIASLGAFCLLIALYDVLSLPTLRYPEGYNRLGYTPLSVLATYAVAATSFLVERERAQNTGAIQ